MEYKFNEASEVIEMVAETSDDKKDLTYLRDRFYSHGKEMTLKMADTVQEGDGGVSRIELKIIPKPFS